jgi:predicted nucleotidyltransferase
MVTLLFGGPSLEGIDLSGSEVTLLPPAAQGDLLRYVKELRPRAVGLLDCELPYRDLPTWHKEIIHTLNLGIPVVGAASVGAHRAAELAPHGMEGVGSIYLRVVSGELERDDEILGDWEPIPEGFRQLSLPLVVMRDVLKRAAKEGIFSPEKAGILTEVAEDLFWRHRTWETLFEKALSRGITREDRKSFENWLPQAPNPVREDALALLERLQELGTKENATGGKNSPRQHSSPSSLFKSLNRRDRSVPSASGSLRQWCLGDMATFAHPEAEDLNRRGLDRKLLLLLGTLWKIEPREEFLKLEEQRLRRRFDLKNEGDLLKWMQENDLDREELDRLLQEEAIIHSLHRWLMQGRIHEKNTGALLDEMKLQGKYGEWKKKAARREALLRKNPELFRKETATADTIPFLQLLREHLRGEKLPWKASLIEILGETGMELTDFMDEIVASRVTRVHLNQTLEGAGKRSEESPDVPS